MERVLPRIKINIIQSLHVVAISIWLKPRPVGEQEVCKTKACGHPLLVPASWCTFVTTSAARLDVVTPEGTPLPIGGLALVDSGDYIELARIESAKPALYGSQLREFCSPFPVNGTRYRWMCLEGIWSLSRELVVAGRQAVLECANSSAAHQKLRHVAADDLQTTAIVEEELSGIGITAWRAKWFALRDLHSKAVRCLECAWADGVSHEERESLFGQAAEHFAVDFNSRWRISLPPLSRLKRARRKDARRRKPKMNLVDRYLAQNCASKGLLLLTARQLADDVREATGNSYTPSALQKKKERLSLYVPWEGHPPRRRED